MTDFDIVAYAMLGLSLSVSAVQIGGWLLSANPRAILNAGRWSALALGALTPLVLLWLVISGRSTLALMLAAFLLPVFVQGARRWGALLSPLSALKNLWASSRGPQSGLIDPELAEQCAAVLQAYLQQTRQEVEHKPSELPFPSRMLGAAANGTGRKLMSTEEAREVLGLGPAASGSDVTEAYRRLEKKLDPETGGTRYLTMKINEARDVLMGV